jgi:hypothetical protein
MNSLLLIVPTRKMLSQLLANLAPSGTIRAAKFGVDVW